MSSISRGACLTLGKAVVICVFSLTLSGVTSATFDGQKSGGVEDQKIYNKIGIRAHGFVRQGGVFTPIDAPGAGAYTMAFGIDSDGRTVGGYVESGGAIHGYLFYQGSFTMIDFPGAGATFAARINDQGQIVGAYAKEAGVPALQLPHGFLLQDGVFTPIDFPGARRTQPFGINNLGQIVGEYVDAAGTSHGFLRDNKGVFTTINAPGGASTIAFDIDDNGRIVGVSFMGDIVSGLSSFLRDANGVFTTIAVPDAQSTIAFGINNLGQIVGEYADAASNAHGFLLAQCGFTPINFPNSAVGTFVFDVNDAGQFAGLYDLAGHGYLKDGSGGFTTIDHPTAVRITGEFIGINNLGQIVGTYADAGGAFRGFMRDELGGFTDINVREALETAPYKSNYLGQTVGYFINNDGVHGFLLDRGVFTTIDARDAEGTIAVLTVAYDIDNHGQVIGQYQTGDGMFHSYLRSPSGVFTDINVPGAAVTGVSAFNDLGQIVGIYGDINGNREAFLLDRGVVTPITTNIPGAMEIQPFGINNSGQVVGFYTEGGRRHGFMWSAGQFIKLPDPPGTFVESVALDINDMGQVVGNYN